MRRLSVAVLLVAAVSGLLFLGWWVAAGEDAVTAPTPRVTELRVEHARNPIAVDTERPRLSWRMEAGHRGAEQRAYQVRVASDPELLSADEPDVWDSGVVEDPVPTVDYAGPSLTPTTRYFWQVRVWNRQGRVSPWSDPATWEMALLEAEDWGAEWIGGATPRWPLEQGNRLSTVAPAPVQPTGTHGQQFTAAGPFDRIAARLATLGEEGSAATLSLHEDSPGGPVIAERRGAVEDNAWFALELDEPAPPGDYALVLSAPEGTVTWWLHPERAVDGTALENGAPVDGSRAFVATSAEAEAHQGLPLLRHEFTLPDDEIARARLYVTGLGYHEVHLNGERVSDHVLEPGFTDYTQTVLYAVHDATGYVRPGDNAVGVALGSGWFGVNTPSDWGFHLAPWHGEPRVLLRLVVEYADGSTEVVTSSPAWRSAEGPVRADSVYGGEVHDARLEQPGWTEVEFDDREWEPAEPAEAPAGELRAQPHEPLRIVDTVEAVEVSEVAPGVHVYDFGRVMSGWARLQVRGQRGRQVHLTYGMRLADDGTVDVEQDEVEGRIQTDTYIVRGDTQESWQPRFSVKGFRYVQVDGYPGTPARNDLTGQEVRLGVGARGHFDSSDQLLVEIHDSVRRVVAGNLQSVYTADMLHDKHARLAFAVLSAPTAMHQFDLTRFFAKWLDDLADAQRRDGQLPAMAPTSGAGWSAETPAIATAYPIIAWELYRHTGDERVLERHYEGVRAAVEHLVNDTDDWIIRDGFGDWGAPGAAAEAPPEDPALIATASFYRSARALADIAETVGEDADAQRFWTLAEEVRAAFNAEFLNTEESRYETGGGEAFRQTSQVVPLALGMVPDEHVSGVLRHLVDDLAAREARLDTGAVGTRHLLPVLTEGGAVDLAYRVATQTEYPSWGNWIEHGVSGLLDSWELDARSHGHHAFASVGQWLYEELAGLAPLEPGYATLRIRPRVPTGLQRVAATLDTPRGTAASSWRQDGERFLLRVTVPPGATAEVHVPAAHRRDVREGGEAVGMRHPDVAFDRVEGGAVVFEVRSGTYVFESILS